MNKDRSGSLFIDEQELLTGNTASSFFNIICIRKQLLMHAAFERHVREACVTMPKMTKN